MPVPSSLPKGSAAVRGCSDVPHVRSLGGQSANTANRLYMFIVRRGSLFNKKRSLEIRLDEINQQLRGLDLNIKEVEGKLRKSLKMRACGKRGANGNGASGQNRTMEINF